MRSRLRHLLAMLAGALAFAAFAGDAVREVHGSSDRYAERGVVLAWGVLRGVSEETTLVVARAVVDPAIYRAMAVAGVDPFGGATRELLPTTVASGKIEYRSPRARFAELPRTEFRFYATQPAADTAALVVYFQGVPDTAPEFTDAAKLDAYLAGRTGNASDRRMETKP